MKFSNVPVFLIGISMSVLSLIGCNNENVVATSNQDVDRYAVKVTPAEVRKFVRTIQVQGNIDTKEHVLVAARIDGLITDLFVDKGDEVVAGVTPLFQIDKVRVEQGAKIARQDLEVAKAGLKQAEANLANMQAQYEKAKVDFERFQRLYEKKAVPKDTLELQETRYKASKAGLEHAEAVLALAKEQLKKAEYALVIAEKHLSDSLVYAPISGKVSYKFMEENEFIGAGRPVLKIDNPSVLEACAFLPAEYYPFVRENESEVKISTLSREIGTFKVTYKSPTVLPNLRTFEVKSLLTTTGDDIVPGAMVQMDVILESKESLGVPKSSVLTLLEERFVFKVIGDRVSKVTVETGLETEGWVEIKSGDLQQGDLVVTMGQSFLRDGQIVQVFREEQ